jgi:hypothetical protein
MLILPPAKNYNSFLPLADLEQIMMSFFPQDAQEFGKLNQLDKEALAMWAGLFIRSCKGFEYDPHHPLAQDVPLAQVAIMAGNIGKNPLEYSPDAKAIKREKVGDLEVEYDTAYKSAGADINPLIYRLLSPFGCSGGSSGFSQSKVIK